MTFPKLSYAQKTAPDLFVSEMLLYMPADVKN